MGGEEIRHESPPDHSIRTLPVCGISLWCLALAITKLRASAPAGLPLPQTAGHLAEYPSAPYRPGRTLEAD